MKPESLLRAKDLFLFDLDGVFYKGKESRVKIGGTKAVEALRKRGKKLFVLTNNSTDSVETVYSRLRSFGIPIRKEEVLTSGLLTADYLHRKHGRVSYFLVGEAGLEEEMRKFGHRRTQGEKADFVVVGLDRALTYDKLDHAARLVRTGAPIVATHISRRYMYKTGPAIATGPIVKAIEFATEKRAIVIGKPSPLMFRVALERAECDPEKAVMIGDQVDTDLIGAKRAGIDFILVTSGVDTQAGGLTPIATISNVDELVGLL
ncbi:MAG: HAD-IIA family hydrolase [Thaumarchaeota archaeon]|nr:HAD-IIA family hydrolase [Nitrososphaerota archaeon]